MDLMNCVSRMAASSTTSSIERPEPGYESMNQFAIDTEEAAAALQNVGFCSGGFRRHHVCGTNTNQPPLPFKPVYPFKSGLGINVILVSSACARCACAGVGDDEETVEQSEVDLPSS